MIKRVEKVALLPLDRLRDISHEPPEAVQKKNPDMDVHYYQGGTVRGKTWYICVVVKGE